MMYPARIVGLCAILATFPIEQVGAQSQSPREVRERDQRERTQNRQQEASAALTLNQCLTKVLTPQQKAFCCRTHEEMAERCNSSMR